MIGTHFASDCPLDCCLEPFVFCSVLCSRPPSDVLGNLDRIQMSVDCLHQNDLTLVHEFKHNEDRLGAEQAIPLYS